MDPVLRIAAQVEGAFRRKCIITYEWNQTHCQRQRSSLPAEVSPFVSAVLPLHNFSFKRPILGPYYTFIAIRRHLVPTDPALTLSNNGIRHFVTPGDYAKIYDLTSLYQNGANGSGRQLQSWPEATLNSLTSRPSAVFWPAGKQPNHHY